MPAPIAITRTPSDLDSFGTPRVGSLTVPGSASYREAMAMSFGKEVTDIMDYSISKFASSTDSDATALPSTSMARQLEKTFCRNFTCCGQALDDLHDLLQHYEECHVRFEDDDLPAMISDDDLSSASSSQPPSPRGPNASSLAEIKRRAAMSTAATPGSSTDSFDDASAFDTAVMRSPVVKGKKRSFGQYTSGSTSAVHQSLRRALIDGGVGRINGRDIYSANSPFSTPDSSMPGTPIGDNDNDTAFFGHSSGAPLFSSLSLRNNFSEEHNLPSCAPPNLFFPSAAASSASQPPAKRERINAAGASVAVGGGAANEATPRSGTSTPAEKPFKCPAPGCDKAYKQMNGLKYHRIHGHCNQNNAQPTPRSTPTPSPPTAPTTPTAVLAGAPRPIAAQPSRPTLNLQTVTASPQPSAPPSPCSSVASLADAKAEKSWICQVGSCQKRYKNLNGLRYHYLHSGSHGLLGLALLTNNGGQSARVDSVTGRPIVSTQSLTPAQLAAAAEQAVAAQNAASPSSASPSSAAALAAAVAPVTPTSSLPSLPLGPSPKLA